VDATRDCINDLCSLASPKLDRLDACTKNSMVKLFVIGISQSLLVVYNLKIFWWLV